MEEEIFRKSYSINFLCGRGLTSNWLWEYNWKSAIGRKAICDFPPLKHKSEKVCCNLFGKPLICFEWVGRPCLNGFKMTLFTINLSLALSYFQFIIWNWIWICFKLLLNLVQLSLLNYTKGLVFLLMKNKLKSSVHIFHFLKFLNFCISYFFQLDSPSHFARSMTTPIHPREWYSYFDPNSQTSMIIIWVRNEAN
jgi:hypothetical protein